MEPINVTADAETFTCNAYLLKGETTTLVDVGSMSGVVDVIDGHVDGIDRVVLTHQHTDHVAELDAVLDAFDAELVAYADHPRRDVAIEDGDRVQIGDETCDVVFTPGHAGDHVAFLGETRLYSGDVVVYNDGAFEDGSFGRTDMTGQSRERLIESLETLLDRLPESVTSMYPGHGDVYRCRPDADAGSTGEADADAGVTVDDEPVRDVIERALERANRRQPKYPDE